MRRRTPTIVLELQEPCESMTLQALPLLLHHIQALVALVRIIQVPGSSDTLSWRDTSDGKLSQSSAWQKIRHRGPRLPWPKLVWNSLSPPRVNCFGWRLMHNRLPSDTWLKRIGISLASRCSLCRAEEDSIGHLFFKCEVAKSIWVWLLQVAEVSPPTIFSPSNLWTSFSSSSDANGLKLMAATFINVIYFLWKARNEAIFEERRPSSHFIQANLIEAISFSLKHMKSPYVNPHLTAMAASLRVITECRF